MSIPTCCLTSFAWNGTPTGQIDSIEDHQVYIAKSPKSNSTPNSHSRVGILIIHDMLGWTFPNVRLLADHYAAETGSTVYVPDFFGGETLPFEPLIEGRFNDPSLDLPGFRARNARDIREPEVFAVATELRTRHDVLIAVGFCYGGWAAFRLGAEDPHSPLVDQRPWVDAVVVAHPSLLTKEDIDGVVVPTQVLAPEIDPIFNDELKRYTFDSFSKRGVPFDWQHFPGVEHACMTRGDTRKKGEKEALERGKAAVVGWVKYISEVTK